MVTTSELLDRAAEADSIGDLAKQGAGGTLLAIASALITNIITIGELIANPLGALGNALSALVTTLFTAPLSVIDAGAAATAQSLLTTWRLGPFTLAEAVFAVIAAFWVLSWYVSRDESTNVPGLLGTGIDIPTPFFGGPEEEEVDE